MQGQRQRLTTLRAGMDIRGRVRVEVERTEEHDRRDVGETGRKLGDEERDGDPETCPTRDSGRTRGNEVE